MTPKALNLIELILVLQEYSEFRVQDKDQECDLKSGPFWTLKLCHQWRLYKIGPYLVHNMAYR